MKKNCNKCGKYLTSENFYKCSTTSDGLEGSCKECKKKNIIKNQRRLESATGKNDCQRSVKRLLWIRVRDCYNRCSGNLSKAAYKKSKDYIGLECMERKEFLKYIKDNFWEDWVEKFNYWEKQGFQRKFTPSIDRIDNLKGYIPGNLQIITLSENSRKGMIEKKSGLTLNSK